jgi:histidinol-phosphate/aromatic aminotransferase/cobyric acid decarboxylase-like protein
MNLSAMENGVLTIGLATEAHRRTIYAMRHAVYATELGQHAENEQRKLSDALDEFNVYVVATRGDKIAGFVSITPPGFGRYSIDKYLPRDELPFSCDGGLFEVRILTVAEPYRGTPAVALLMYAALRWIESHGGQRVVAIGRREVLSVYRKAGLQTLGRQIESGAVTFQLMTATVAELRGQADRSRKLLSRLQRASDWQLDVPFWPAESCYHGGRFFDSVGVQFDSLDRRHDIVNADVLDAWFPPAPQVLDALRDHLDWIVRTSPPTHCEGMVAAIAEARGVPGDCIAPGAGSSELIFAAFRNWLTGDSRVLILDPTYGEYAFVLERIVGCRVDRLPLCREQNYDPDLEALTLKLRDGYELVVLVNPNSPTGRHVRAAPLKAVLRRAPRKTLLWIDETYTDFVSPDESLERFAAASDNVVVCKSMSKAYALSGVRAAYLCGPRRVIRSLRFLLPPWAVSLPGQIAAVKALASPDYYQRRWTETAHLRRELTRQLRSLGLEVVDGTANFLLCHLSPDGPDAARVVDECRARGVFLRDFTGQSAQLDRHALRVAVKDTHDNDKIVKTLQIVLAEADDGSAGAS